MLSGPAGALPAARSKFSNRDDGRQSQAAVPNFGFTMIPCAWSGGCPKGRRAPQYFGGLMVGAFRLSLLLRRRGPFMVSHLTLPNDANCRPASAPKSVLAARFLALARCR